MNHTPNLHPAIEDGQALPETTSGAGLPAQSERTPLQGRLLTHDGRTQTVCQWGQELGIRPDTIYKRLERGHSVEEALSAVPLLANIGRKQREAARRYEHGGLSLSITGWAERLGLSRGMLVSRLKSGWTLAQAIGAEPRPARSGHMLTFQGKTQNATDWARELGLDVNMVHQRLSRGWSAERALSPAPDWAHRRQARRSRQA
jgi:hypothetical protein